MKKAFTVVSVIIVLSWCVSQKPQPQNTDIVYNSIVEERELTQQEWDTILPETEKSTEEKFLQESEWYIFNSDWFWLHILPVEETVNISRYQRAWNTVVVSYDAEKRKDAVALCKNLNLEKYHSLHGVSFSIDEWKKWCELYAFESSSIVEVIELWITIDIENIIKSDYFMISPLSVSYVEWTFSLLIDPCSNQKDILELWLWCAHPASEQFIEVNWWILLIQYKWALDYEYYFEHEPCNTTFECWSCLKEEIIQRKYCPTWPSTRYYGKKLWDNIIGYVESDEELLDAMVLDNEL